jgi:hypothetical protein
MTPAEIAKLTTQIARMYTYVVNDATYMGVWKNAAKDAEFKPTLQRFYDYVNNPANTRRPPLPGDILVRPEKDGFDQEKENIKGWEEQARANPPDWERFNEFLKRVKMGGVLDADRERISRTNRDRIDSERARAH